MRQILLVMLLGSVAFGQTMVDGAAAATGGFAGGIGGKKVSDRLSRMFDKVDQPTGKGNPAAKERVKAIKSIPLPLRSVRTHAAESVPPPPPVARHAAAPHKTAAPAPRVESVQPPSPEVVPVDLRTVTFGMDRTQLLELGEPASRMTTSDDGHLIEVYRYTLGVVHLTDGEVSSIDLPE